MQEIIELRSQYAKHFQANTGKHIAEIYTYPVHYLDRDTQAWEDSTYLIELDEAVEGFVRNMKAAPFRVRFGVNRVRFGFAAGKYITYQFQGANVINPAFEDHKATFAELYNQTDVIYSILTKELKQEIVLKDATAPTSFTVLLESNVTAELVDNGVEFKDGETVVGRIPSPFAVDAIGARGAVILGLESDILTIAIDQDWLATAVYPITIDPTTTIQPDPTAGKDTQLDQLNPNYNYATAADLTVGLSGGAGRIQRSIFEFNVSGVPRVITSADFMVYFYSAGSSTSFNVTAHKITSSWDEGTADWNLAPTHDVTVLATVACSNDYSWKTFALDDLVESWRNGSVDNYGVMLKGNETTINAHKAFYSSDYISNASLRPKLVVEYAAPTVDVTSPASTDPNNPTAISNILTPTFQWAIGGSDTQKIYQVKIFDSNNNLVRDYNETAGAAISKTVSLLDGLVYGEVYSVRVRVQAAIDDAWSEYAVRYFKCVMASPVGLTATADAAHAEVDLNWTAHAGEHLAGYRIYRKLSADSVYEVLKSLVITNSYSDRIASSGVTYDYKVAAIATDGYESPLSANAQDTVTFIGTWIDATEVKLRSIPKIEYPRRASSRTGTDGEYITQDLGLLPRTGQFTLAFDSKAIRDSCLAMFPAGHIFEYRGPDGETFRGKVIGEISESRFNVEPSKFYGDLTFGAVEVA